MNHFTDNQNFFWRWSSKIGTFFGLSIFWILLCIPVITAVPASIALFDSVAHCVHKEEDGPFRWFFRTLKKELLKGIGINAVWLVFGFTLIYGYSILYQIGLENQVAAIYSLVYLGTMLIPVAVLAWLIPIESRFEHGFFSLHKTAAIFALAHLPTTVLMLALTAVGIVVTVAFPAFILLMPAIVVTIQCWFVEKVFAKYIPDESEDETNDSTV